MLAQQRDEDEDRPDAVDDAGDGGKQFSDEGQRAAQHTRTHLRNKDGDADRQRNCDDEGDEG